MEYVIIGACIVVAIAGGIVLYVKNKRTKNELGNTAVVVSKTSSSKLQASEVANDPVIQIGILPADAISDETKLVEITDSKVLAHINNLVPGLAQAGNAANNATQAVKANGEVLYRAIIPAGAKLTDSKAMEGAVRGFYHGADGIRGHANLVAVEAQKGTAVAAMGVASMIVGQYYMTQINAELGVISDGISQIQNFQDNEYRSRVFSLVAHVKKIADFQTEILENDELRLSKIAQLDSLEEECTKLLGQANLTLAGFAKKSGLNYDGYEKALGNAQNWFMYQQSLLEILYKISDLRYTLHLGTVSREQCMALLPTYSKQVSDTQTRLTAWHEGTADRLGIEADESRRKRAGFDGVIHFIPGLFNDNLNFRGIEEKTASMITAQKAGHVCTHKIDKSELYAEDVQLISKDEQLERMGLYWIRPYEFINLDSRNRWFIVDPDNMPVDFVNSVKKKLNKVPYAAEYLAIKDACLHALKDGNYEYKNYPELSYRAWIVSEQVNQEKAEVKGKKSSKAAFLRWFAPLIQALRDLGGSGTPAEARAKIIENEQLSEDEINETRGRNNVNKFENEVAFARNYLVNAGYIDKSVNITVRQSRQSGVARATCPD